MVTINEVREGDTVEIRSWGGDLIRGTVQGVYDDVKNGRPGLDYVCHTAAPGYQDGGNHWCYMDQVERVVR